MELLTLVDLKTRTQHSNEEKRKKRSKKRPPTPKKFCCAVKYAFLPTARGKV
jgi:hypothetical protein